MKTLSHNLTREKLCTYALDGEKTCGKPFVGRPVQRYCPEHVQAHRARSKRKWRRISEHRAKQEGRA